MRPRKLLFAAHVTRLSCAQSISTNGFFLDAKPGFGKVWGDGVYLALDSETTEFYEYLNMPQKDTFVTLLCKAEVRPLFCQASSATMTLPAILSALNKETGISLQDLNRRLHNLKAKSSLTDTQLSTALIQSFEYDSLLIKDSQDDDIAFTGGHQLVVFDPAAVQLVSRQPATLTL